MATKERELLCVACGKYFIGKTAYTCPDCVRKKKEKKIIKKKESSVNFKQYTEQIFKEDVCPNFDKESVSCVVCPAGAFKFKACGRVE